MYQSLEKVRDDLKQLQQVLDSPAASARVARITAAFDECAQRVSDATCETEDVVDRAALQKLYRGLVAARSIVQRLHELPGVGEVAVH
ncbi:type III secretion system protein [Paraburkholderia rhizosphaerae]|uniref:Type III secretion system (T3SS) needle YscE family protein n=1 Tax=Paraburkholderia rhizosphaerae TaxID=480658 RepID=A0A4R8LKT8_9BURK|nr:type III secretion system protein [Paraburkholderia rhizosphaerae]TDY45173.1 hypothetical protein BX592_115140 [Paraburkholderia rhizosphaerae]